MQFHLVVIAIFGFVVASLGQLPDLGGNGVAKDYRNDCIRTAIAGIIAGCMEEGVESLDPVLRKISAVKLSICEFMISGIDYPHSCHGVTIDYDVCILDMKASPQFWTTYSLSYKEIGNVCYQESLPFEKDQIITMYANITEVINNVFQDFKEANEYNDQLQLVLKAKFDDLLSTLSELVLEYKLNQEEIKHDFHQYKEDVETNLNNTLMVIQETYNGINTDFNEIETYVTFFTSQLKEVKQEYSEVISHLEFQNSELFSYLETTSSESQAFTNKILENFEQVLQKSSENQQLGNELSSTLKENQVIETQIQSQLYQFNHELLVHNDLILAEFNRLFSELSIKFNHTFEQQLNITGYRLTTFMDNAISNLDLKLNETESILNGITVKFENMLATVKNVSDHIQKGFTFFNSIPNSIQYYLNWLKVSVLRHNITWSLFCIFFPWNSMFKIFLTFVTIAVKFYKKFSILQFIHMVMSSKVLNYILITTSLLIGLLLALILYRIIDYIDNFQ